MRLPTIMPTIPHTVVSHSGMLSRSPGATHLPSSPMIRPPTRVTMMVQSMRHLPSWRAQVAPVVREPYPVVPRSSPRGRAGTGATRPRVGRHDDRTGDASGHDDRNGDPSGHDDRNGDPSGHDDRNGDPSGAEADL